MEEKQEKEPKQKGFRLRRDYKKSENFKSYYVTGAAGGFKNPYDFRLTFFRDDINDLIRIRNQYINENLSDEEIKKRLSETKVPFILQCELIMTEKSALELYNFLGNELKKLNLIPNE